MERLSLERSWRLGFHGYKVYRGSYQNRKWHDKLFLVYTCSLFCHVTFPLPFPISCLQVLDPAVGSFLSKILKHDTSSIKIACGVDFLLKDMQ